MKKIALMTCALIALGAGIASADAINLSWGDCGAFGTHNLTWACNANLSATTAPKAFAVASFFPPSNPLPVVGIECRISWSSDQSTLVPWWQFGTQFIDNQTTGPNGCRSSDMSPKFDASSLNGGSPNCLDYFGPLTPVGGGLTYYGSQDGATVNPQYGTILVQVAAPFDQATALSPTTETYATWLSIDKLKTTGTGSCAGCTNQTCLTLQYVSTFYTDNSFVKITTPGPTGNTIAWQGAPTDVGCPLATPTQSKTWGELKSLYR